MKTKLTAAVAASMLALSACGGQGDDTLGDQAADQGEARAENLEEQAEAVEENAQAREEAIDDADIDASELTQAERNAAINGQ